MFISSDMNAGTGRGPFDDFWYGPVPNATAAGVRVNDDLAMRLSIVYACVKVISEDLAKVPLLMYRRRADGGRTRVYDHPAIKLLRKPAPYLTGMDWKGRMQAHMLLRGNAFCEKKFDARGNVVALIPFKPDNVRGELLPNNTIRYLVRDTDAGSERIVLQDEMLHLRGLSLDGPLGLSPIDQAREALGEAYAAQSYAATFFANDARPGLWLEHPGHFKDENQRSDWITAFKKKFGGSNRFSPVMLEYGIKLHEIAVNHSDIQFLEIRKLKNNEICGIFRVPQHKVGILERSTNNNIEHQGIEYVTDCLLSWCRRWEESLSDALLTDDEQEEYYFEFMLNALMRGDAKSRNEAYASAITNGWMTRNEVRRLENLDPLEELDEPLQPLNMVPAGQDAGEATDDAAESAKPDPVDEELPSDAQEAAKIDPRFASLAKASAERVARREIKLIEGLSKAGQSEFSAAALAMYEKHAGFVSECLSVELSAATDYCASQLDWLSKAWSEKMLLDDAQAIIETRLHALALTGIAGR